MAAGRSCTVGRVPTTRRTPVSAMSVSSPATRWGVDDGRVVHRVPAQPAHQIPVRLEATEDGHPEREGQQSVGTDRGRTAVAFILADRERSECLTTSPGTSAAGAAQTPDRPGVGDQPAPHDSRDHMIPGTTKDVDGRHPTKIAASGRFSGSPRIDAEPVAEYALPGQALRSLSGSGVVAEVRLNDSGRR